VGAIVESTLIFAPPEQVFDYRRDITNLPRYNPSVTEVEAQRDGSYRFRVRLLPGLAVPCALTITEAVRPRRLCFAMESLFRADEVCTFEAAQEDGRVATRLRFETHVHTPGGKLAGLMDAAFVLPIARSQLRRELTLMKAQLERAAAAPASG
jgi:uncharacterized membrane protein